jgi:protein-disulfide isomerase
MSTSPTRRRAKHLDALSALVLLTSPTLACGQTEFSRGQIPSPPPYPVTTNTRLVTVTGSVIDGGTLVVENGVITATGIDADVPAKAPKIDGEGLTVHPGLIDALSTLRHPESAARQRGSSAPGTTEPDQQITASFPLATTLPEAGTRQDVRTYEEDREWLDRADASRSYVGDSAAVRIDEFIDFACSTCQGFFVLRADSLKSKLVDSGEVNLIVRAFPLSRLMRGFQAAEAAFCAGALAGRRGFEGMQHRLFMNQGAWQPLRDPTPILEGFARELGLSMAQFSDCLARDAMAPLILYDVRLGHLANAPGTPTFVFNKGEAFSGDIQFYGNQPLSSFQEAIERARQGG